MDSKNSLNKAQILILGTYHFSNAGVHVINVDIKDVMTRKKQEEIDAVIDKLIKFHPNKIAVEVPVTHSKLLNKYYSEYCSNVYTLGDNNMFKGEIEQLGFKLGKILNHNKIYAIDVPASLPFESVVDYAQKHNKELYKQFENQINKYTEIMQTLQKRATVGEILKYLNNKECIDNQYSNLYFNLVQVGAKDTYCGANFLSAWYDRNIKIFANLQSIAKCGDKILVIYGADHVKILDDLVSSYKKMKLVETMLYLF